MGELIDIPQFHFTQPALGISISLMRALALALAACGDSETEGAATLPPATVPPAVTVTATHPPTEVPTKTPDPPRNTPQPYTGSYNYTHAHEGSRTDACPRC